MIRLPVLDGPDQTYTITLEGSRYVVELHFNSRTRNWYMDLTREVDGVVIANGVKVKNDFPLFDRYKYLVPEGLFVCVSLDQNDNSPPVFADLPTNNRPRCRLLYFASSEIGEGRYTEQDLIDTYGGTGVFPL